MSAPKVFYDSDFLKLFRENPDNVAQLNPSSLGGVHPNLALSRRAAYLSGALKQLLKTHMTKVQNNLEASAGFVEVLTQIIKDNIEAFNETGNLETILRPTVDMHFTVYKAKETFKTLDRQDRTKAGPYMWRYYEHHFRYNGKLFRFVNGCLETNHKFGQMKYRFGDFLKWEIDLWMMQCPTKLSLLYLLHRANLLDLYLCGSF